MVLWRFSKPRESKLVIKLLGNLPKRIPGEEITESEILLKIPEKINIAEGVSVPW